MDRKFSLKNIVSYVFGIFLLAMGASISIKSNLGVSPVNSLPYAISLVTGMELGKMTIIVFSCYIGIQAIILRRDFKLLYLLQIIASTVFGYCVTFSNHLLSGIPVPGSYPLRFLLLVLSIFVVALGLYFYLGANILPLPSEGVMQAVVKKTGISSANAKVMFDCTSVVLSAAVCLIAFRELGSVREGTVLAAIFVGKVYGLIQKVMSSQKVSDLEEKLEEEVEYLEEALEVEVETLESK